MLIFNRLINLFIVYFKSMLVFLAYYFSISQSRLEKILY